MTKIQRQILNMLSDMPTVILGDTNTFNTLVTWKNDRTDFETRLIRARIELMRANNRV